MRIKLIKYEMTSNKKIDLSRGINTETKYNFKEINVTDFSCDVEVEFKIPFVEIGINNDEYSIATAVYLISDVPTDNDSIKKQAIQVAINEIRTIVKDFTIQMTIDRTVNIQEEKKDDIDFFDDNKSSEKQSSETVTDEENSQKELNSHDFFDGENNFGGLN